HPPFTVPSSPTSSMFSFKCSPPAPDLRSFPTRRSSDLRSRRSCPSIAPIEIVTSRRADMPEARAHSAPTSAGVRHIGAAARDDRLEDHTSELQSPYDLVCRLLLEKKKKMKACI